jgi:hypothetical protein
MPNEKQLDHMRHALGISQTGGVYRNHFCTGPDSKDWNAWNELVEHGLASRQGPLEWMPDYIFRVTDEGKALITELQSTQEGSHVEQT